MTTKLTGRFDFYIGDKHVGGSRNQLTDAGLQRLWAQSAESFAANVELLGRGLRGPIGNRAFNPSPFFTASLGQFQAYGSRLAWDTVFPTGSFDDDPIFRAQVKSGSTVLAEAPISAARIRNDEELRVVYSLSIFPTLEVQRGSFVLNRQPVNYIIRPSTLGRVQRRGFRQMFTQANASAVIGATYNESPVVLDGTVVSSVDVQFGDLQVANSQATMEVILRIPDSQDEVVFNGIRMDATDSFNYQIIFDRPIRKRDVDSARVKLRFRFGNTDYRGHA